MLVLPPKIAERSIFCKRILFAVKLWIIHILISAIIPSTAQARQKKQNILVLQSYHERFACASNPVEKLRAVFDKSPERIELYTQYFDAKRFAATDLFSAYHDFLQAKYLDTKLDLIIAFDSYAVSFINRYKNSLFPDTPILICGLENVKNSFSETDRGYTGIFAEIDVKNTLKLILDLHPDTEHIFVISDNTPVGIYTARQVSNFKKEIEKQVQVSELYNVSSDILVRHLRNLPDNSIILLLSFYMDSTGKRFDAKDVFQLISTSCNVPVYTVLEDYVYQGAVGGVVLDDKKYYRKIADRALSVLRGKPIDTIPVVTEDYNKFFFDYNKLKQLKISDKKIPVNSVIINKPISFYSKNISVLISAVIIIAVLFLFVILFLIDALKVKKAKKELFVFKKFAQGSGQGLAMVDFNYNITYLNPALCKMLGIDSTDSYIGKSFLDFYPPDIRKKFQEEIMPLMLEQSVWTGELSVKSLHGVLIPTLESCFVIYDDKHIPLCFGSVVSDTTKIKKTESELRLFKSISDSANYGSVIADIQGQIIYVNNYMAKTHGYTVEELKDSNLSVFFSKKDLDFAERLFYETFKHGDFSVKEISHTRKDGIEFPMLMNGVLIQTPDKQNPLVGITAIDITDHKKLLNELMKKQKLESISLLAGGIAHDFNNLLFCILGNISLVMTKIKNDDLLKKLSQAERASEQARYLSRQLLTFSKGGIPAKQTTVLADIIKETVEFTLKGSNIKPVFHIPKSLYAVEVDHTQISQVIHNIVLNSYQAMHNGGIIEIICENIELDDNNKKIPMDNGKYLLILIKDQGVGICEENIDKVFDPYFTTRNKNVGLGLTICYSIMKRHDGYIDIESEQNKGTSVYIYLPASNKPVYKKNVKPLKEVKKNANILIMEADELVLSILCEFFQAIDYKCQFAKNSKEAISLYEKSLNSSLPFDAVFMDLTIPGSPSPVDTIKKLKKLDKNVKVILSSGYTNDPIVVHYKENGFSAFLGKPFSVNELRNILNEIL